MERDFVLMGSTAIDDKLQDGVPKCIADLAIAGISTWMLTGDKEETAINIAHACLLLDTSMSVVVINYNKFPTLADVRNELVGRARQVERIKETEDAKGLVGGARQKFALVIDGDALAMVMAMDDKGGYVGCQAALLRYVQHCVAVVACRCAPSQKAEIVRLVRDNIDTCRSLAIGDGANDVPMIQEAHVGVGISGHEGLQAVNSSDFAIAQFRFLQELLLVQGRHNYRRMSLLVQYLFYKNVMMVLTQYWFTIANTGTSGQKFNPEFGTQAFNVVWTFPMIVIAGIFDKDTSDEASRNFPQMYNLGIQNYYFSRDICLKWFFDAIIESLLVCFFTISAIDNLSIDGQDAGLWMTGGHTFSIIIFTVNLKLFLHQHRWHWLMFAAWAAVTLFWIPCCIIGSIENTFTSENWSNFAIGWYGLWWKLQTLPGFWLLMVLVPFILLAPQALRCVWRRYMYPEITDLVGEFELFKVSGAEKSLLDWKIVAPPPPQVCLEGWDTADEKVISGLGPLPLGEARPPPITQQGPSSATLLAPVPDFAGAR
jgi:phospholipid-translocating P-type ATPase (flippase)